VCVRLFFDFGFDFCKKCPGFSTFFAKIEKKVELKIVPLDAPPRSTFAKIDRFDFCKILQKSKSKSDFCKINFSNILSFIMLKKTDRSILDGNDTMMMRTGI
jgi:hypothetical protein